MANFTIDELEGTFSATALHLRDGEPEQLSAASQFVQAHALVIIAKSLANIEQHLARISSKLSDITEMYDDQNNRANNSAEAEETRRLFEGAS